MKIWGGFFAVSVREKLQDFSLKCALIHDDQVNLVFALPKHHQYYNRYLLFWFL